MMKRLLFLIVAVAISVTICATAIVTYPQPLFAHSLRGEHLEVWADKPFDEDSARRLMADIEQRLNRSPLYHSDGIHRIFIVNAPWRRYLTFFHKHSVGGLNYYPITRNVFIREADISAGRVIGPSGKATELPRTLAYFAAHEIGHTLIGEELGWRRFLEIPVWLNEGMADRIALPEQADLDTLAAAFRRGDPSMDPARSGLYAYYRLLVSLAIERNGWSPADLLASSMSGDEARALLLGNQ